MNTNDVNTIIDNICSKLGTTVEMVVPEYAKYMIASKVISLIIGMVIALRCSCCEKSPKHAIKSDFCPNCGARMVELQESEEV